MRDEGDDSAMKNAPELRLHGRRDGLNACPDRQPWHRGSGLLPSRRPWRGWRSRVRVPAASGCGAGAPVRLRVDAPRVSIAWRIAKATAPLEHSSSLCGTVRHPSCPHRTRTPDNVCGTVRGGAEDPTSTHAMLACCPRSNGASLRSSFSKLRGHAASKRSIFFESAWRCVARCVGTHLLVFPSAL